MTQDELRAQIIPDTSRATRKPGPLAMTIGALATICAVVTVAAFIALVLHHLIWTSYIYFFPY